MPTHGDWRQQNEKYFKPWNQDRAKTVKSRAQMMADTYTANLYLAIAESNWERRDSAKSQAAKEYFQGIMEYCLVLAGRKNKEVTTAWVKQNIG